MSSSAAIGGAEDRIAAGRIPLDLRIGITGHRWVPSNGAGAQEVLADVIQRLRRHAFAVATPATPTGLTLVSALAEGADRLAAQVAIDLGGRVEVVLPMDRNDYEQDWKDDATSAEEFARLYESAARTDVAGTTAADRDEAYLAAGLAIVERVDVLLAVWDGQPAAGTGGTADIVRHAKTVGVPVHTLLVDPDDPDAVPVPEPAPDFEVLNAEELRRLDAFNGANLPRRLYERSTDSASSGTSRMSVPELVPFFVRADVLAMKYQRRSRLISALTYAAAVLAVAVVAGQLAFDRDRQWAWLEIGLLAFVVGLLLFAVHDDLLGRWTSARLIAERVRAVAFLAEIGAQPSFTAGLDRMPGSAKARWAHRAIVELWFRSPAPAPIDDPKAATDRLTQAWIDPQLRYHRRAERQVVTKRRRTTRIALVLFGMSGVAAALHATGTLELHGAPELWAFVSIVVPALASGVRGFAAQQEYQRHASRSRQVQHDLAAAVAAMDAAQSIEAVRQVAARIDTVLHGDAAEWFYTTSLHEPELP